MFFIYKTYFRLKHAGITVYRVKVGDFINKAEDEKNPRELTF